MSRRSAKSKASRRPQVGALPYRHGPDGGLELMLVTSRETRRWVIPKGWPAKKLSAAEAAAREAREEAGLVGQIRGKPVGSYRYLKRLDDGRTVTCEVRVYPFQVEGQLDTWPEQSERQCAWMAPTDAARAVDEADLQDLLARAPELLKSGHGSG